MSYRWNRGGWRQAQPHCQISADCTCHEPLKKTWPHRWQGEPGMHPDPWHLYPIWPILPFYLYKLSVCLTEIHLFCIFTSRCHWNTTCEWTDETGMYTVTVQRLFSTSSTLITYSCTYQTEFISKCEISYSVEEYFGWLNCVSLCCRLPEELSEICNVRSERRMWSDIDRK